MGNSATDDQFGAATIAVKGGVDPAAGDGVTPPIHLASTFVLPGTPGPGILGYARGGSPAYDPVETALARLEGGVDAILFSAGVAAANALLDEAKPGTALVMPYDAYYGLRVRAQEVFPPRGIEVRLIDQNDL